MVVSIDQGSKDDVESDHSISCHTEARDTKVD